MQFGGAESDMRSRFGVGLGVSKSLRCTSFFEVVAVVLVGFDRNMFPLVSLQSICLVLGSCFNGKSHFGDNNPGHSWTKSEKSVLRAWV